MPNPKLPPKQLIAISSCPELKQKAKQLAHQLDLHYVPLNSDSFQYLLNVKPLRIELICCHRPENPVTVDFCSGKNFHRYQYGGGKSQLIAKACAVKTKSKPRIADTTGGLGSDAFALACLGCDVTIMERHPIVSTLLQDGIDRAKQTTAFKDLPLKLITGNAIELLSSFESHYFDVIYLDPMYPHRSKSSQVKKEMRILRELVGDDDDSLSLFNVARQCARQRTVVKRPSFAPPIGESDPHFSYKGRSARFDVYLAPH